MILRIVRMEFRADQIETFHQLFDRQKHKIRAFPGCRHLELHRDPKHAHVRYTYSHWENSEALKAYRNSGLFRNTWEKTKQLFESAPQAYSLEKMEEVMDFQEF